VDSQNQSEVMAAAMLFCLYVSTHLVFGNFIVFKFLLLISSIYDLFFFQFIVDQVQSSFFVLTIPWNLIQLLELEAVTAILINSAFKAAGGEDEVARAELNIQLRLCMTLRLTLALEGLGMGFGNMLQSVRRFSVILAM
jgi:hypothetical protein